MAAISKVIEFLGWLQEALYKAYLEILDLPLGLWVFAWPFYLAADAVNRLGWAFYDFYDWVQYVSGKIPFVMTPTEFLTWLGTFFPQLTQIEVWFWDWVGKVKGVIISWWSATSSTVLGWIDTVRDWVLLWIDWLDERVSKLTVIWNTFVTITLPTLPNWLDINKLITDTLKLWFPFYDSLASLWDSIAEFISDPMQWFYDRLDELFERYW